MDEVDGPGGKDAETRPPFLPILLYVLGFMGALALLAFVLARFLRPH